MNKEQYIRSRFRNLLNETLEERTKDLGNRLNLNKDTHLYSNNEFDYVQEDKGICEQCGSEMKESECNECGWKGGQVMESKKRKSDKYSDKDIDDLLNDLRNDIKRHDKEEIEFELELEEEKGECMECGNSYKMDMQELGGMDDGHPRFGKTKLPKKMSTKEIERLLRGDDEDESDDDYKNRSMYDPYYGDDDEDLGGEVKEKLYGKQRRIDKNKNGKIDSEDFKLLRRQQDEEQLYEVEFTKSETDEGNAFTGALAKAKKEGEDTFEVDGKKYNVKESYSTKKGRVKESILYTESDLIDLIEKLVVEETKKFKKSEPKGYREYERAHKADKKENDDYLKSVAKKMTDYLKNGSDKFSKYEMKETKKFPTENGGLEAKRKKYVPSQAVDDYIEAFSYPGQTNLVFDEIKPNDDRIEKYLKGHSTTGNAQVDKDGNALGNVVPSEVGERFFKNYKENLYGQEQQDASYKRQPQPVDQAGEDTERGSLKSKRGKKTSQSVLNKLEESLDPKTKDLVSEEFERMQQLMGYNRKTQ